MPIKDPAMFNQLTDAMNIFEDLVNKGHVSIRNFLRDSVKTKALSMGTFEEGIVSVLIDCVKIHNSFPLNPKAFLGELHQHSFMPNIIQAVIDFSDIYDPNYDNCFNPEMICNIKNELLLSVLISQYQYKIFEGRFNFVAYTRGSLDTNGHYYKRIPFSQEIIDLVMIMDKLNKQLLTIKREKEERRFISSGGCKRTNG